MGLLDRLLAAGTVVVNEPAGGRMRRIVVDGPEFAWTPGQHVGVFVAGRIIGPKRTYSVWSLESGRMELRIFDHGGDAPGAEWARTAAPGDRVTYTRPDGRLVAGEGEYHLFVGVETAQAPFTAIVRGLGEARWHSVAEAADAADLAGLPHGFVHAKTKSLVDAVRVLELPGEPGIAYVAGEARTVQAVRAHLVGDRGWPRRSVMTKPFWTPGRRGMD
ncbi:siderophore-interacting protein [Phytomonospora endophytica]|uniref:NADPH-dependent ferric siderophore reductase n=1 Tax=Phytomonospora endophytica TaxID=714109 RepID=A0A841FKE4_9ACTN|nr:siderophore-interacting protein [Phytomonospora endophytica]MBB6035403.1 NADPH-dependent ferric siderophore reductase [Phytomonospora endophytica]GIG63845.1 hypothetical protein Pen01_01400 [Phytomonospora endophytica]